MEKKYLFKRAADSKWIFGPSVNSVCKSGLFRIETLSGGVNFVIYALYNRDISIKYPDTFSNYKKENGQAYASLSEFLTATVEFFDPGTDINQPKYIDSTFTLTRPANTTPYSDGDAIRDTVGIATQKFAGVAKLAGRGVNFINLVAFTNDTGLAGKTINVVFYKESPASPIADNSAFTYGAANELIRKGTVQLTFGTGILAGVAQLGIDVNTGMMNLELCPTATDVYCQVWLPTGYTPSANSTYIIFKVSAIQN